MKNLLSVLKVTFQVSEVRVEKVGKVTCQVTEVRVVVR
jgi:hypothetical protein